MAAAAGMRAGDRLRAIDGRPIDTADDARRVSKVLDSARAVIAFERDGGTIEVEVEVSRWPAEALPGAGPTEYGHVTIDGARLRTLTTPGAADASPGVVVLQGIARASVDFALAPDAPLARLVAGLAEAGFATLRIEKWGVGDSEGRAEDADLARELAAIEDALDVFAARPDVGPVFGFGHSLGGMELPLLARPLAGAVVYGTSPWRWSECMAASARRQLRLRGLEGEALERAAAADPARRHGVTAAFLAQLEARDLRAAWRAFEAPVLALHGEHDWVVSREETEELAALAPRGEARALPGIDHALGAHADRAASLADYGRGALDDRPRAHAVAWIRAILRGEGR